MELANRNQHLPPAVAAALAAFSPEGQQQIQAAKRAAYVKALQRHDWAYDWSDDHRVWSAGQASLSQLRLAQRELDPDFTVWNEHCPFGFENGVAA